MHWMHDIKTVIFQKLNLILENQRFKKSQNFEIWHDKVFASLFVPVVLKYSFFNNRSRLYFSDENIRVWKCKCYLNSINLKDFFASLIRHPRPFSSIGACNHRIGVNFQTGRDTINVTWTHISQLHLMSLFNRAFCPLS